MATPSKLRPVYRAVCAEAARLGATARAHVSRFDPDGAVMFFTSERDGHAADETTAAALERAAQLAGGWLLGARAQKLDAYLRSLRETLDPNRIMNPGTLS
jgi:FAD/FMN-containing dehydrogenase